MKSINELMQDIEEELDESVRILNKEEEQREYEKIYC